MPLTFLLAFSVADLPFLLLFVLSCMCACFFVCVCVCVCMCVLICVYVCVCAYLRPGSVWLLLGFLYHRFSRGSARPQDGRPCVPLRAAISRLCWRWDSWYKSLAGCNMQLWQCMPSHRPLAMPTNTNCNDNSGQQPRCNDWNSSMSDMYLLLLHPHLPHSRALLPQMMSVSSYRCGMRKWCLAWRMNSLLQ